MKDIRPATIFCDIDGTLVIHNSPTDVTTFKKQLSILPGTLEKLKEWDSKGYNIILVTGRKESLRKATEHQLRQIGIIYDKLIMGIGGGKRYIINDTKPENEEDTAIGITLKRNTGIQNINI
jgi:FMN phosphatase YigB (HAD superfamily)